MYLLIWVGTFILTVCIIEKYRWWNLETGWPGNEAKLHVDQQVSIPWGIWVAFVLGHAVRVGVTAPLCVKQEGNLHINSSLVTNQLITDHTSTHLITDQLIIDHQSTHWSLMNRSPTNQTDMFCTDLIPGPSLPPLRTMSPPAYQSRWLPPQLASSLSEYCEAQSYSASPESPHSCESSATRWMKHKVALLAGVQYRLVV